MNMNRREFLGSALAAAIATSVPAAEPRPPRILLRSSWQVVNIGDIAHTPGVLALIETHLPDAEVILWASGDLNDDVARMEHRRFPKLRIVKGSIRDDGQASNAELGEAVAWTDFLLHGSGPSLVAARDVAAFLKQTGKPFGVYGITYSGAGEDQRRLLIGGPVRLLPGLRLAGPREGRAHHLPHHGVRPRWRVRLRPPRRRLRRGVPEAA